MYDSSVLLHRAVSSLHFLPPKYIEAFEVYVRAIVPTQSNAQANLHSSFLALQSTVQALLSSLSRPPAIISQMRAAKREADRNFNSLNKSRWPLGLLDDTRQRLYDEKEERARKSRDEAANLAKELRFTQQTVAGELAGWQDLHEKMGRQAIREFVRGMVVQERMKLDGMLRAIRRVRMGDEPGPESTAVGNGTIPPASSRATRSEPAESSENGVRGEDE